jgi:hypothetical protein
VRSELFLFLLDIPAQRQQPAQMGMNSDVNPRDRQCISNSATRTSKYSTRALNPKTYLHTMGVPQRFLEAFYLLFRVNHGSICIPTVSGREASCIQPGARAVSILRHGRSGWAPATNATSNNPTLPSLCFTTLRSGTIPVPAGGFSPRLRIKCWAAAVLEWMLVEEHKAAGQREKQRRCLDGKTGFHGLCKTTGFPCRQENFWMPRRLESRLQSASHESSAFRTLLRSKR